MRSVKEPLHYAVWRTVRYASRAAAVTGLFATTGCPGSLPDPAAFLEPDGGSGASVLDSSAPPEEASSACPDVPTMLVQTCGAAGCHDDMTRAQALDLKSANVASRLIGVHATEGAGLLINSSSPTSSVLYTKVLAMPPFGARMPRSSPLDTASIQCLLAWVTTEASSGSSGDAGATVAMDSGGALDAASDGGGSTVFSAIRVAAGQTSAVADAQNNTWNADTGFTAGTAAVQSPPTTISGTDSSALYNGQRYGDPNFSYAFSVPNGNYSVTLKFAETYVTGPQLRVFSIAINSAMVEPDFDIYAVAGAMNTAVDRSYPVKVTGGMIQIDFAAGAVQFPKVDAILVSQGDGGT